MEASKGSTAKLAGWQIRNAVTVEPSYALYCLVETMSKFLHQAFMLDKFTYNHWAEEPPRFQLEYLENANNSSRNEEAMKFVAFANSWLIMPATFVTVIYTTMAISWSDKAGRRRRPIIFVPLVGLMLECAFAAIHAYFWHWPVHWMLVTFAFLQVAFGGRICFSQVVYLYMADITTKENRTARYGILMTIRYFMLPIGYAAAGLLLHHLGFFYTFSIAFAISLTAALLGYTFIDDMSIPVKEKLGFWQSVNPKYSFQSMGILVKKRPGHTRSILIMIVLAFSCYAFSNEGELSVMYLYFRHQFSWNESQIGFFLTFKLFAVGIGTLVCSLILSKCLKMEDGNIGILIGIAKTAAAICYTFAHTEWQLYVAPLIDMYFAAGVTVTRSLATKLVTSEEMGRLAVVLSMTKISFAISPALYNMVFARTMNSLPSAFFLISVLLAIFILILTCISQFLYRKQNSKIAEEVLPS